MREELEGERVRGSGCALGQRGSGESGRDRGEVAGDFGAVTGREMTGGVRCQ